MSDCGEVLCAFCGAEFARRTAHQRFCTDRCKYRERDRRRSATGLSRSDYLATLAETTTARRQFSCIQCGTRAERKVSGTNQAKGYENKYCSLNCRDKGRSAAAAAKRLAASPFSPCFARFCLSCSSPFVTRTQRETCSASCGARAAARAAHKVKAKVTKCDGCKAEFCPLYGSTQAALCEPCAEARRRAHKRVYGLVRKARQRGATVEPVNPFKVFVRDGWRCQLCGISTPRDKRGSYADDAPELDHIIALARGGEHSYRNTHCACRKCNRIKSDKPLEHAPRGGPSQSLQVGDR